MGKLIQMVRTSEESSLFLYELNESMELTFRSSKNIGHLQKEKVIIQDNMVYTNLYFFNESFLKYIVRK